MARAIALAVAEDAELPVDSHLNKITAIIQDLTARGDADRYRGSYESRRPDRKGYRYMDGVC